MTIEIKRDKSIYHVQCEFANMFPYLKLEFFQNTGARQDRYSLSSRIPSYRKLAEAWKDGKEGLLSVPDSMTVLELETELMQKFGLAAQVFRKSGNIWLETIVTDNWSLKQQNDHGRELSEQFDFKKDSQEDYDLIRGSE